MSQAEPREVANGQAVAFDSIPVVDIASLRDYVITRVERGGLLFALHGVERGGRLYLLSCIGWARSASIELLLSELPESYPSITSECAQAHWFERELAEQWGVVPEGHPWLHPVRFHASHRPGVDAWKRPPDSIRIGEREFYKVHGEEVHEVAVGPVHAGVIEPGHFRFQCHGETVFHLEISLGYQHRGVEQAMLGGPNPRCITLAETLAGDTTIGHASAYCHVVEGLSGIEAPPRAQGLRAIALELERMANHTGDIGALAGDIAYLPTASYCGRLRGDLLNLSALLCGSRFGRGLVRPGGVAFDLDEPLIAQLCARLDDAMKDLTSAVKLLWEKPSVMARLDGMGFVSRQVARDIGLVGPAARACGLEHDVRAEYPIGHYRFEQIHISSWETGDVFARAFVRWLEIERSAEFVRTCLARLPNGDTRASVGALAPNSVAVALVEGWRGAICHVACTDEQGRFNSYKVVDPSFHNWFGLALSMRNQPISEFPLCNKSFNLSYCGHDL